MKGMMDFLEKAGLVKRDDAGESHATLAAESVAAESVAAAVTPTAAPTATPAPAKYNGASGSLNLADIYVNAGVPTSLYPAERLLRLVDGLSAMDQATRNLAIKAMDAADESWTIDDPLNDAAAKLKALAGHGETIRANLQQLERETQARLDASRAKQEKSVGEIRKQMAELEALLSREMTRGAQEIAAQEANLAAAREQAARELGEIAQTSQQLQSLAAEFGSLSSSAAATSAGAKV